jgi:hypothetical protein
MVQQALRPGLVLPRGRELGSWATVVPRSSFVLWCFDAICTTGKFVLDIRDPFVFRI